MALLRDKMTGFPIRDRLGNQVKITTEGEMKTRDKRNAKRKTKEQIRKDNEKARKKRTPEEQLRVLDARLGVNTGAQKERARLLKQIEDRIAADKAAEEARLEREAKAKAKLANPKAKKTESKAKKRI